MWYEVLEPPFPEALGLPENCTLALVCEEEECPLVIGSAAHSEESLKRHRMWFETWASFLNDKSVHWSDKENCRTAIEAIKEAARLRREGVEPASVWAESPRKVA